MGYANIKQVGRGIHTRVFARAFVVEDEKGNRVAFVSADAGMMGYGLKREVIKRLQARYGNIYHNDNVAISGTHTHGAPGGFLMHLLYDISILGFVPQTFEVMAQGLYLVGFDIQLNLYGNEITNLYNSASKGRRTTWSMVASCSPKLLC